MPGPPPQSICGVVVSAKMMKAVKVRTGTQRYHKFLRKHFPATKSYLVSDPNSSLRLGDVVRIADAGRRVSRRIRHVVTEILAPWGSGVEERPPLLSEEERGRLVREKTERRRERRREREREGEKEEGGEGVVGVVGVVEGTAVAS